MLSLAPNQASIVQPHVLAKVDNHSRRSCLLLPPTSQIWTTQLPDLDTWFDDGNIIPEVERTLFKVHRSILATHCFQENPQ